MATATASTPPVRGYLTGDYDGDDHSGEHYGDADNDDSNRPKDRDRDNDSDSNGRSYYDGDDDSVRDFGHAANTADRRAITSVVERYYAAVAREDGATACSVIVSSLANTVPEDLGRPPGPDFARGNTCAVVMSKVFREFGRQLRAYAARLEVTGVRLEGDHGVAVLGFKSLPGRQIRVAREGGVWKMDALLDSELP